MLRTLELCTPLRLTNILAPNIAGDDAISHICGLVGYGIPGRFELKLSDAVSSTSEGRITTDCYYWWEEKIQLFLRRVTEETMLQEEWFLKTGKFNLNIFISSLGIVKKIEVIFIYWQIWKEYILINSDCFFFNWRREKIQIFRVVEVPIVWAKKIRTTYNSVCHKHKEM